MVKRNIDPSVVKYLRDPEFAAGYLKQEFDNSLELESSDPGKNREFLISLGSVLYSTGKPISYISKQADITKSHTYRIIKGEKNPTLNTLRALLREAGITLDFVPLDK